MIPTLIEGFTRQLGAPIDIAQEDCATLGIRDLEGALSNEMWSAWEPTHEELAALNQGGKVYLKICGAAHPMVWVCAAMAFDPIGEQRAEQELKEQLAKEHPQTSTGRLAAGLLRTIAELRQNSGCAHDPEQLYAALEKTAEAVQTMGLHIRQLEGRQVLV